MFSDNHSGIIWSLAGLTILTLTGVFLSILVDKKHGSSRERNNLQASMATNEREISGLGDELEFLTKRLTSSETRASGNSAAVSSKAAAISQMGSSISDLRSRKAEITRTIPELRQEFDTYRMRYRDQAWADAVGEEIESIMLKSGRHFERVTITKVTPVGLEISHPDGNARIDAQDLSLEFRDRFQWDDEERQKAIEAERKNRERLTRQAQAEPKAPGIRVEPPAGNDVEKTRSEVRLLQTKVLQLRTAIQTAESESRYANNRSVPGSLRTWAEQANILKADLIRTEAQLSLAKENLRSAAPNDPLLRAGTINR